jgi:hypothetical protein
MTQGNSAIATNVPDFTHLRIAKTEYGYPESEQIGSAYRLQNHELHDPVNRSHVSFCRR